MPIEFYPITLYDRDGKPVYFPVIAGKSAYQSAVSAGYTGTEAEFNKALTEVGTKVTAPATAEVGQTIVVSAVGENGKPTEWEAADIYNKTQIDAIMGSYITDIDALVGGEE